MKVNVDLTPLEGEGYDPNEPDPEPYDDSKPFDLAKLEDDMLQLHPSNDETDEVVPPPPADEIAPAATSVIPPAPPDVPSSSTDPSLAPANRVPASTDPSASTDTDHAYQGPKPSFLSKILRRPKIVLIHLYLFKFACNCYSNLRFY